MFCVEGKKFNRYHHDGSIETYSLTNWRLGREWFGTSSFNHPSPAPPAILQSHFPNIVHSDPDQHYSPEVIPSNHGETIIQLHDRLATTLAAIIARVDSEVDIFEALQPHSSPMATSSKAIIICSHAAPLIAMGRTLTGHMPEDPGEEDFKVFTTGLSTFVRRKRPTVVGSRSDSGAKEGNLVIGAERTSLEQAGGDVIGRLAPGTKVGGLHVKVPDWTEGKGVGGGWDCISNSDCSFLNGGEERGWLVILLYPIYHILFRILLRPISGISMVKNPSIR